MRVLPLSRLRHGTEDLGNHAVLVDLLRFLYFISPLYLFLFLLPGSSSTEDIDVKRALPPRRSNKLCIKIKGRVVVTLENVQDSSTLTSSMSVELT